MPTANFETYLARYLRAYVSESGLPFAEARLHANKEVARRAFNQNCDPVLAGRRDARLAFPRKEKPPNPEPSSA